MDYRFSYVFIPLLVFLLPVLYIFFNCTNLPNWKVLKHVAYVHVTVIGNVDMCSFCMIQLSKTSNDLLE